MSGGGFGLEGGQPGGERLADDGASGHVAGCAYLVDAIYEIAGDLGRYERRGSLSK